MPSSLTTTLLAVAAIIVAAGLPFTAALPFLVIALAVEIVIVVALARPDNEPR